MILSLTLCDGQAIAATARRICCSHLENGGMDFFFYDEVLQIIANCSSSLQCVRDAKGVYGKMFHTNC